MAPGLNGRQTGTVPKNKSRNNGAQSHRNFREALIQSSSLEWEPVLDQNSRSRSHRKISSTHSETEADSIRYDLASSLSSTMSQSRFEDNFAEGSNQEVHGSRIRGGMSDKKQLTNKITQIQDYFQETASLMNDLKSSVLRHSSDWPEKERQCEELSVVINDFKDVESKLMETLKNHESVDSSRESLTAEVDQGDNNNSDSNEEELIRRTEESKKKLELLQKRKQELIELQYRAKKQLQEAQMEQSRLVARASSLNQDINSNRFLDLNVQQLSQRLKTAQQLYKTSNQINETLADSRDSNTEEPEHPDEDQTEMSDTETDFQIVSDKVAELNMMKAQLAQIQKLMGNISLDQSGKGGMSTPTELTEDRRDQGADQRTLRNESVDEGVNNAIKLEQAKLKLNQLTQILEVAQSTQGGKGLPPGFLEMATSIANEDCASIRRTPSPSHSGKSQQRTGEESYVETMQSMTRELEERTAAMKEEHDKLVAARQELENLARKIPLVKDRGSLSPDDSGSEAPCLTNITLDSNGRLVNSTVPSEQQSPFADRSPYTCRPGHSKTRAVWNAHAPSGSQEKKCKNEMSRGQLGMSQNGLPRGQSRWSPSPTVSFCDNGSCSAIQTQNHLEKSGNMYGSMMTDLIQRSARPEEISVEELYTQHQMLTRTVAQCSHLLWLQQKQIIELRNTLMLQQSAMYQNALPQPSFPNQPPRNNPLSPNSFQFNPIPSMPYVPQMPLHQEQNYLPPNQSVKLNSSAMPNIQSGQDFADQYYLQGAHASLPNFTDVLDYQFRFGNCNRLNPQQVNSNSNVNQNLNQSGLNNRIPVAGMSCLGPEDSGALNNQVPPGNRANNYWDNFRSYSRQNLLSHSKSNEDTDSARRTSITSNQERPLRETSSSITVQNNSQAGPSHESGPSSAYNTVDVSDYDGCQSPAGQIASTSRPQSSRSRSVESHNHRKNESRNQENDTRLLNPKNEASTRGRNPETGSENIRSVRNDVGQPGRSSDNRNFVQLVRDLDNDEGRSGINKRRMDKSRSRNEGLGNLNNRANTGLPAIVRDNVYSEVTNFIRANESRPDFLIQLFRDLQQVTTDPLRQRALESIQETVSVSVNNLTERSNLNGTNLNIIDNRNNIRESRSNLNRQQGDEQSLDNIVCQIWENQNTNRQNIAGNSVSASGGNNLENPNISNIRILGSSRNNLESEGLRDLRTYFEANLCNFGHNSALENPNLSNIRENLTRRVTAASDLDNTNPKNLYLSMYDNAWRRNQESNSGPESVSPFHNGRNSEQFGNDYTQTGCRGNNSQCFCNNEVPLSLDMRGDSTFCENRQDSSSRCAIVDRDNRFVNVAREAITNEEDSEEDNTFNSDGRKRGYVDGSCDVTQTRKKNGESRMNAAEAANVGLPFGISGSEDESGEEQGAVALIPVDWNRETSENRAYVTPVNAETPSLVELFYDNSNCTCSVVSQLDDGDLAEADQSRNEETAEASGGYTNQQIVDVGEEKCVASNSQPEESGWYGMSDRRTELPGGNGTSEAECEGSCLYDNTTSESEGMS